MYVYIERTYREHKKHSTLAIVCFQLSEDALHKLKATQSEIELKSTSDIDMDVGLTCLTLI